MRPDAPEYSIALVTCAGLITYGVIKFYQWLTESSKRPDPWDATVTAELANDEATPVCHHCLAPHDPMADFCAECGCAVGAYTNMQPLSFVYSRGQVLRLGTSGEYKRSVVTILGFLLFSCAEYVIFFPVYWFIFLSRLFKSRTQSESAEPASD